MPFTKVRMGNGEIFDIKVNDEDGRTLESWKVMKRDFPKVVKILNGKYGLGMRIKLPEEERDLDWAK